MDLGEVTNELAASFPNKELYNLSSQIRRAGDSIALNISEGSILQSDPEFRKFLSYAIRSIAEVVTCLYKVKRRNYITDEDFKFQYTACFNLMNMSIAFRDKLKSKK